MAETLLDAIRDRLLTALAHDHNAVEAPVVLLWPDKDRQFETVVKGLADLPILTLGPHDEGARCGPAYWLRCAIAGTLDLDLPAGTPIVYLPGVGREDLRAVEDCPAELAPLAELQYRGQWFAHPNGKDWTPRSLLINKDRGLGLAVSDDAGTTEALTGAFGELLALPLHRLTSQHIDAGFLHSLLNPDPVARLLEWLDDPVGFRTRTEEAKWDAFVSQCKSTYEFDPERDGEVTGGRKLGEGGGAWEQVRQRFTDDPERFAGVEEQLRKGKPVDQLFAGRAGAWPQDNEDAEDQLRVALVRLADAPAGSARDAITKLWQEHQGRRQWVWAKLDRSPLVFALEHLQRLAELTSSGPAQSVDDLRRTYAEHGWQADNAFLATLQATTTPADRSAASGAALPVYRPWLDAHARALQDAIGPLVNAGNYEVGPEASTEAGAVTVFVDGLRLDLAYRLADRLGSLDTELQTHLAAIPTVTDTAKPVLTPVPDDALVAGKDLGPARASSGAKASAPVLRGYMGDRGGQTLSAIETGDPSGWAWTEAGTVDSRGHQFQSAFVDDLDRELDDIAKRVKLLLDAGWSRIEVVTDHGWLLVPGGMERVDLPAATVEVKKGRCARLKDGADVDVPTVPWHWDSHVRIALAPGISCFEAGKEYEHGGVSLQECVVPRLVVRSRSEEVRTGGAAITKVKWLGLMCRVEYEHVASGVTVDVRALPADATTSVAATVKEATVAGKQSLHVPDEELEGERAYLVLVGGDGRILAQREVTIGQNR